MRAYIPNISAAVSLIKVLVQGIALARDTGILVLSAFDLDDYEFHERVENGDSTWIIPGQRHHPVVRWLTPLPIQSQKALLLVRLESL